MKEASIIFIVDEFKLEWYKQLSRFIQSSTTDYAVVLPKSQDGKDKLSEAIKATYDSIAKTMTLIQDTSHEHVDVNFESSSNTCNSESGNFICTEVLKEVQVSIEATFTISEEYCANLTQSKKVEYHLEGFKNDKLEVEIQCKQCECDDKEIGSADCNSKGDKNCGGCDCW